MPVCVCNTATFYRFEALTARILVDIARPDGRFHEVQATGHQTSSSLPTVACKPGRVVRLGRADWLEQEIGLPGA